MPEMKRAARLGLLRQLLEQGEYTSQQELSAALAERDVTVSQSTLSKDLVALGAVKRRSADGALIYAIGSDTEPSSGSLERLARLCAEVLHSIQHAGNHLVIKTPPGAAQFLASHLDAARLPGVMGTIAGDDTVLLIAINELAAEGVSAAIAQLTRTGKPVDLNYLEGEA